MSCSGAKALGAAPSLPLVQSSDGRACAGGLGKLSRWPCRQHTGLVLVPWLHDARALSASQSTVLQRGCAGGRIGSVVVTGPVSEASSGEPPRRVEKMSLEQSCLPLKCTREGQSRCILIAFAKASHMEVGWERLLGGGALPQLGRKKILVLPLACCYVPLNPRLPACCQRSGSHARVRVTREGAWQCFKERFFCERAHMRLPASV